MIEKKFSVSKVVTYIVLTLWGLTTVYPFIWVILNSFRKKGLILTDSFSIPLGEAFTMDNYKVAMERSDFGNAYLNSILISGTVTIVVVILAGLAAYGLCRYRFRGRGFLQSLVMAGMMFPVFSTIIPVFRMQVLMGVAGTGNRWLSLVATALPQIAGNLCFAIVILKGFILFTQSFFLRYPQERAITGLLNEISSQAGVNYGLMASSVVLVVVPVLIVYMCLQKHIIKGLTAGAVKG